MKSLFTYSVFIIIIVLSISSFAQNNDSIIDSLPQSDKAEALLKQAKYNLNSNFSLADEYSQKALLIAKKYGQKDEMGLAYKYLGITEFYRRNFDESLIYCNKALQLFKETENYREQANVYNNVALNYRDKNDYINSLEFNNKSLRLRKEHNDAKGIIGSLQNIGVVYSIQGDYDKALKSYEEAQEISKLVFPEESFPSLLSSMAHCYSKRGNTEKAIQYYLNAIEGSKKDNNIRSVIISQHNLGNFYYSLGSSEKAIYYHTESLNLAEKSNMPYFMGVGQLNIGNIYYQDEQYKKARELYSESLKTAHLTNDTEGKIKGLINVALCNEQLGLQDSAKVEFLRARQLSELLGDTAFIAMTANYLGKHFLNNGENKDAINWLNIAFNLASKTDNWRELYMSNFNIANYWFENRNYEKALTYFETAYNTASNMESVIFQKDASEGLWKSYEKLKKYEKAFELLITYNVYKDSIFNSEKQSQIIAVEGKFNLNLKENQIESQKQIISQQEKILEQERWNKIFIIIVALLLIILVISIYNRKKIRQQKEKSELIRQNLTVERDLLQLQMNPHFIFNALNSIQSFISENDSFMAELFLSKFARLMRYYLDSSSEKWVNFSDEILAIELNLEIEKLRLNDRFEYKVLIDDTLDKDEIQIPPMLLQPFIENAVKHGLRPKQSVGFLKIDFTLKSDYLHCYIEDNGIGREAAKKTKKVLSGHSSKGVKLTEKRLATLFTKNTTINYLIINDLKANDGSPSGTRVDIIIPFKYF